MNSSPIDIASRATRRTSSLIAPLAICALLLTACGGAQPTSGGPTYEAPVEGEQIWTLRYNPPPCLSDQPELHVEVETPAGWERVILENGVEAADGVSMLLEQLSAPGVDIGRARANLTDRVQLWGNRHASRVMVVLDPSPPAEPPGDGESEPVTRRIAPSQGGGGGSPPSPRARSRHRANCASAAR